ncbi:hypothetical protein [Hippea alviniae]|uniref:hypothetical protein n=1 Tax=Hippea alviniae TaxID=1279027 RepID=UPI0003B3AE22|nr:hypothetical protein [Hippea alviniae]
MNSIIEKAFNEIKKLPEEQQKAYAEWILEEIKAEKEWDKLFEKSQDILSKMAEKALKEHSEGKTSDLNLDKL